MPLAAQAIKFLGLARLLDHLDDAVLLIQPHDAHARRLMAMYRHHGHGDSGTAGAMRLDQVAKRHAIELICGQNQDVARAIVVQIAKVLANGVGGAAIPVGRLVGLLGGEDLDKAVAEGIELVGVGNMAVQADAEELREDVEAIDAAVDAVAKRDVDEAIFPGDGHGRLTAMLRQGIQRSSAAAAENQAEQCRAWQLVLTRSG